MKTDDVDTKNYINILNKPTRLTNYTKSAIDHVLIKMQNNSHDIVKIHPTIIFTDMTNHYSSLVYISKFKHNLTTSPDISRFK